MARLGLAGDVMLGRLVDEHHRHHDAAAVWGDIHPRLEALDGFLINLECCLSTRGEPWTETYRPFHFRAHPSWAIPALEAAGVDACSLANNHLLDFGPVALSDTVEALDGADIDHAGAGDSLDAALEPATFPAGEFEVAVFAFTDNTPEYAAGPDSPGVARITFDVDDDRSRRLASKAIRRASAGEPDVLVASLHWGPNMVEEPSGAFREFARWLASEGADLVFGHSAHVFQGIEVIDGVPVLYDTGDFVDDYAVDDDRRNDLSFLFEVQLTSNGPVTSLRLAPTAIRDCRVTRADDAEARWSRERMRTLSAPFGTDFDREGSALVLEI